MRTIADAENDFDRALEQGARAVEVMQKKLLAQHDEALRVLAAVVLAAGGKVEVRQNDMLYKPLVTITSNPVTGGFTITARGEK